MTDPRKCYLNHAPEKVALVGMGPSIMDYIAETMTQEFKPDFADEIWTINMASNAFHSDLVIWMDDLYSQETFKPGLMSVLRRRGTPVLTSKAYPDILPNSYDFPIDEVSALSLKVFGKPYLTNGVAQAIAYGMVRGVKVMKIYGADFTYPNRDYAESGRACVEAWISYACSTDIMQIQLCPRTSLFDSVVDKGIYGYAEQPVVTLPDGQQYQFKGPTGAPKVYVPEDSSGQPPKEVKNVNISASLPGTPSPAPDDSRAGSDGANGAAPIAPETVARSGAGLRDSGQAERHQE